MVNRRASAAVARAHTAYRDKTLAVRQATQARVRAQWLALPDVRDANAQRFAVNASTTVGQGRAVTAALTAGFIATVGATVGLRIPAQVPTLGPARGIDPVEQWMRPAIEVWSRLGDGLNPAFALNSGLTRAMTMAATDMQLAKTETSYQVFTGDDKISGYRRVIGPEACDICQEAEGTYQSDEQMALHDNCACDAVPIFDGAAWTDLSPVAPPTEDDPQLGPVLA